MHRIDKVVAMAARVQILGSGDAFGSGGRFQTCILVEAGAARCLLDCGATSLVALRARGIDPDSIQTVFLTHLHGDHFGGVPLFVLEAQQMGTRCAPLTVAGPPGTEEKVRRLGDVLFPGMWDKTFPFPLSFLELDPGHRHEVGEFAVTPHPAAHSKDSNPTALRLEAGGKVIAYSGDGGWSEGLAAAAREADLLIAECYWFLPRTGTHMDYKTLNERLAGLEARRVVLTHLGPEMLARLDRISQEVARDGWLAELP